MEKVNFWENLNNNTGISVDKIYSIVDKENRSSTFFPVYTSEDSTSYVSFLNYWQINIQSKIILVMTYRNLLGEKIYSEWQILNELKTYSINLNGKVVTQEIFNDFSGSVEVEIFSQKPLRFPFPALSLFIEDKNGLSVVHSCLRAYNINECIKDYAIDLPQTGFDVSINQHNRNYVCFVGTTQRNYKFSLTLRVRNKHFKSEITLKNEKYGQLHTIYLEDIFNFSNKKFKAYLNIEHDLDSFPRFYCGIKKKKNIPTLTHSFFNTRKFSMGRSSQELLDLKVISQNPEPERYFDAAFMVPLLNFKEFQMDLKNYGQNIFFEGEIMASLFSQSGKLIENLTINQSTKASWSSWSSVNLSRLFSKSVQTESEIHSIRFGFKSLTNTFPNRFKLSLNIQKRRSKFLGSNICFGAHVNALSFKKPHSRTWFPLGGKKNIVATIHNTSLLMSGHDTRAETVLNFYSATGQFYQKKIKMAANETIFIDVCNDRYLFNFLEDQLGWCMVQCSSSCVDAYFFSTRSRQIGGDHGF